MTYRERRARRAEKLREWAEKRDDKSEAGFARAKVIADGIPMGQPILVGHHSEKRHRRDIAKIDAGMREGVENARKADEMRSKADNIEAAADDAIYSDDPDAVEALEARIVALEEERERVKRFNATCRKGAPDFTILTEKEGQSVRTTWRVCSYHHPSKGFPAYHLANLSGNINRQKKRLEHVKLLQERAAEVEAAPNGLVIRRHTEHNWCEVQFAEKPARAIIDALKAAGYHWSSARWAGYLDKLPAEVVALETDEVRLIGVSVTPTPSDPATALPGGEA